jgi:hypothetical protein
MKVAFAIYLAIFILLNAVGCGNSGPIAPGGNDTPPVWVSTVGIVYAVPANESVKVYWHAAIDFQDPPVEYLLYMDIDNNPWDQTPVITKECKPYIFENLTNDQVYWFGIRCRDSASPTNVDSNQNILSAMPDAAFLSKDDPDLIFDPGDLEWDISKDDPDLLWSGYWGTFE